VGLRVVLDDFGTGYSSLSYLSTLPITSLKIDRSFVQRLQDEARDAEVVKAVITLGHALGKTVIAEGIETPGQLSHLRALGCSLGQGYLLARPLTPDGAATTLATERRWPAPDATPSEFGRFLPTSYGEGTLTVH
ncbi:MAG: EAL domain-containing protein, partial [Rubrivivax sp.]|nr:EAL domain-containing protein [Rubrivivax sp.]